MTTWIFPLSSVATSPLTSVTGALSDGSRSAYDWSLSWPDALARTRTLCSPQASTCTTSPSPVQRIDVLVLLNMDLLGRVTWGRPPHDLRGENRANASVVVGIGAVARSRDRALRVDDRSHHFHAGEVPNELHRPVVHHRLREHAETQRLPRHAAVTRVDDERVPGDEPSSRARVLEGIEWPRRILRVVEVEPPVQEANDAEQ